MTDTVTQKLDTFFSQYKNVSFRKGDVVLSPSDRLERLFYLRSGAVKMSAYSADGEEVILHIFRPPAYFPIMFVLSSITNNYYFEALDVVEAIEAPVAAVVEFLKRDPEVLFDLTQRFSGALTGFMVRIENGVFQDAYLRIVSLFLYLADAFGQEADGSVRLSLALSHQSIASWLGFRRETVSRQVEKLLDKKLLIAREHQFIIPDVALLRRELK
jgi:CRP/FNR family transcriptional regulator